MKLNHLSFKENLFLLFRPRIIFGSAYIGSLIFEMTEQHKIEQGIKLMYHSFNE